MSDDLLPKLAALLRESGVAETDLARLIEACQSALQQHRGVLPVDATPEEELRFTGRQPLLVPDNPQ